MAPFTSTVDGELRTLFLLSPGLNFHIKKNIQLMTSDSPDTFLSYIEIFLRDVKLGPAKNFLIGHLSYIKGFLYREPLGDYSFVHNIYKSKCANSIVNRFYRM